MHLYSNCVISDQSSTVWGTAFESWKLQTGQLRRRQLSTWKRVIVESDRMCVGSQNQYLVRKSSQCTMFIRTFLLADDTFPVQLLPGKATSSGIRFRAPAPRSPDHGPSEASVMDLLGASLRGPGARKAAGASISRLRPSKAS